MKRRLTAACLVAASVLVANARAQSFDDALANGGLAAAEASLASTDLSPGTAFLLGGVQFLRGFEAVFQVRYENFGPVVPMVPGMLNDLPPNPDVSFDPAFVETAMTRALTHFDDALQTLATAVDGEFEIDLNLRDFWFDIDADGARAPWEGLIDVLGEFNSRPGVDNFDGIIRFDTADAEWLAAYVHVVSGVAEIVLSLDPTPAITRVYDGRRMLDELGAIGATPFVGDDTVLDIAAGALLTMQGVPDRNRTRAALAHFKAMVAHNRDFWTEVAQETDDENEWLPNTLQTSAMGLDVGAETALAWENVLDEIDAILDGDLLIPYWRLRRIPNAASGVGLNLRSLMEEPGDMDIILWIQGTAVAPFLEQGALADMGAWRQFLTMTPGNSILFAFWFN